MAGYDRAAVLTEVRRILPEVRMVAVTGSAAFDGPKFTPHSDIDVVAVGPCNVFAWGHASGREVEIQSFTLDSIRHRVQNPQWHTTNWIWYAGKLARAEVLWGHSVEDLVRGEINVRTRLIAASGLIGLLLAAERNARTGRRRVHVDVPLAFSALRHIMAGILPIRSEPDEDFRNLSASADLSCALEFVKPLAREAEDLLRDNGEVGKIMYLPEHRTGMQWLRKATGIDLPMPDICYY
jgi:hypothetical protein